MDRQRVQVRGAVPARHQPLAAGQIDAAEALVSLARRLLDANKDRTGHITTGSARRGEENWVYGRHGRPCRRCGTPVSSAGHAAQREDPQERVTFWCPRCQPDAGR